MPEEDLPSISVVVPTYNSEQTLAQCLEMIVSQDYPRKKLEIIIADGGSSDRTLKIARKYRVDKILYNPLRTGEAGKTVGVEAAQNEIIALIDSDNILDGKDWLKRMAESFKDQGVFGAEPLYYTCRKEDPTITRYCALLGMNDPLCFYIGNYDRYSYMSEKWTELPIRKVDQTKGYLLIELDEKNIPTMGANGFLVRADALKKLKYRPYLFDVEVVFQLVKNGYGQFAKIKIGLIHLFARDVETFSKKTYRRIRDYLFYERAGMREYSWKGINRLKLFKFIFNTVVVFPLVRDLINGYKRAPDKAWLFHPLACQIVLVTYGLCYIFDVLSRL